MDATTSRLRRENDQLLGEIEEQKELLKQARELGSATEVSLHKGGGVVVPV